MELSAIVITPTTQGQNTNFCRNLKKSRIPVRIRQKSESITDLVLKRIKSSFNSSFHNVSPACYETSHQLRRCFSMKSHIKKEVNLQPKRLLYVKEREIKLSSLPSRKINPPLVDWDSRLRNADQLNPCGHNKRLSLAESKGDRLLGETTLLLGRISDFFSQKGNEGVREIQSIPAEWDDDKRHLACFSPYTHDILNQCLIKDLYYCELLKRKNKIVNERVRLELIQRVTQWSGKLKVDPEVVFVTVFIIDAFLQIQKCSDECSSLLAVAAFLIACKMDNINDVPSIETLTRLAKFKYREKEVKWMETFILHKLEFDIFPPTPRYFMELCISQLEFPHEKVKSLIIDLSTAILLRSVTDHQQISLRASVKAKTAILIATEYVMFHKENAADIKKFLFFDKATPKCYELYKKIVLSTAQRANSLPSRLSRGVGVRNSQSANCILVK